MPTLIPISNAVVSTWILIAMLLALCIWRRRQIPAGGALLPPSASQELKGVAILAVLFGHIGYFLVNDHDFLFPLSIAAGVGVNVFLFLSGFGLTTGLLNKPMQPLEFYRRRLIKVFIPFWITLVLFFVMDALLLDRTYSIGYMLQSTLGFFPRAAMDLDVNSPFWYITWMLMYYALLPLVFMPKRPWLTALILLVISEAIVRLDLPFLSEVTRLYVVHTVAFPVGVLIGWLLHVPKGGQNPLVTRLQQLRDNLPTLQRLALCGLFAFITGYCAYNSGIGESAAKEQLMSMITLTALTLLFMLKRTEFGFISLVGFYSYEIYLLHWPLLARYDLLYTHISSQPWLGTVIYMAAFLGMGWVMQRIAGPIGDWVDGKRKPA